jgi:hypothetical protein
MPKSKGGEGTMAEVKKAVKKAVKNSGKKTTPKAGKKTTSEKLSPAQ